MSIRVKSNIHWVGKIDWELRKFHGDEYSTHRGSTYNSYLIKEEKTAIFATVWAPSQKNMFAIYPMNRLWPRGVSKEKAKIGYCPKELTPSAGLRNWFSHKRIGNF
jgi:hypothetical protein